MKEIGGYFGLDWFIDDPYHKNMIELNTGRNALIYLIKAKDIKKIYIPYYLCSSVSSILKEHSIEFEYYKIDRNFMPIFNKKLDTKEYLYLVNYYGQINNKKIMLLKKEYHNLIVDNAQSFFQNPVIGVDTIYSCRKFFGVPDGAYLATDTILKEKLEVDISKNRMTHILGRFEGEASEYHKYFRDNDNLFKETELKKMSNLTKNILGAIDYEKARNTRNDNARYLCKELKTTNILNIAIPNGSFAYPYYIEDGIEIRKKLAQKKIYIPTLWPNIINENNKNSIEYDYAANILPLPCDQRYREKHMEILVKELKSCID